MRILVLSNLYPPYYVGGYELSCESVVNELRKRGHYVFVLMSAYNTTGDDEVRDNIFRKLLIYRYNQTGDYSKSKLELIHTEWNNNRILRNIIQNISPDIIFIWNIRGFKTCLKLVLYFQLTIEHLS